VTQYHHIPSDTASSYTRGTESSRTPLRKHQNPDEYVFLICVLQWNTFTMLTVLFSEG
jgi:hypothetical protein